MIRSLYSRVVLTFIGAVLLGLITAFFVTTHWFQERFFSAVEEDLRRNAQDITDTYRLTNGADLDTYLKSRHSIQAYTITLFDPSGHASFYGAEPDSGGPQIPAQAVDAVLKGGVYQNSEREPDKRFVGFPLTSNGERYALFLSPSFGKPSNDIREALLISLAIVLLTGSVLFLVAARYLVLPLKRMTQATQRIARGDFNIDMQWKRRRDELGELAESFGNMASELKQIEQMRRDFVSNVSHEIQSPLTSIAGFSKVLRSRELPEQERNQYLDIIRAETERLSRLSDNLLKLASLESEHHPFHPAAFDLDEQLRRVIVSLEPQWTAKRLEFDLRLPAVKIVADQDQLNQVWMNLLGNAIKFTPEEGKIGVELQPLIDKIKVSIKDTGIGISPDDQGRVFDRFFKADPSRNRELGGNGLGLSIVKKIVDLHRGTVEVRSALGSATVFTVTLPSVQDDRVHDSK